MNNITSPRNIFTFAVIAASLLFNTAIRGNMGNSRPVTIAFGSCSYQNDPQPVWATIAKHKPDVFIHTGDTVYADTLNAKSKKAAYDKMNREPHFKEFRKRFKFIGTWDDHDYGMNDMGAEYRQKDISQRVYLDFLGEPADSERRKTPGVYDVYWLKKNQLNIQVILLDVRYFRSKPIKAVDKPFGYESSNNPQKTILGKSQWQWLEHQLRQPADIRLLVSGFQVLPVDHHGERWDVFSHERLRLFKLIRLTAANGVIFISGDRHYAEIARLDYFDYPLYEITSSALNQAWKKGPQKQKNRYRIKAAAVFNFGMLKIYKIGNYVAIHAQIRGVDNSKVMQQTIRLSDLQFK